MATTMATEYMVINVQKSSDSVLIPDTRCMEPDDHKVETGM
jgi:hypothetical protein